MTQSIYIVDDDEAVRDSLAALLATQGWQTETFDSAAAFLARYRSDCTGCLLLDVRMPGMTGLELQELLASQQSRLRVIIITGHGNMPMAVKALRLGAVEFLEKPYSDHDILEAIERALTGGQQAEREEALKAAATEGLAQLTAQERAVLSHLLLGHTDKVIASTLGITPPTVEVYRSRIMEKLHARSFSQLVRMALAVDIA